MEKSVADYSVRCGFLLIAKRDLSQIVLALMWIECSRIFGRSGDGIVGDRIVLSHEFGAIVCNILRAWHANYGLIASAPVINVFTPSPLALEGCLSLTNRRWVIEIPRTIFLLGRWG